MKGLRYDTIRAAYIAWVLLVNSAVVAAGLYYLPDLSATTNVFLLAVLGLLNVPVAFFFHDRWAKQGDER